MRYRFRFIGLVTVIIFTCFLVVPTAGQNLGLDRPSADADTQIMAEFHDSLWSSDFILNPDTAISLATRGFNIAKGRNDVYWKGAFQRSIGHYYMIKSEYGKALDHFQAALGWMIASQDTAGMTEVSLAIGNVLSEKAALDSATSKQRLEVQALRLSRQRYATVAVGGGLLSSIAFIIFIFHRLRVTRRQKAEIEEQKQRAEISEKHQEVFLANMSHEIRTPIHAISGMTKILKRNIHDPSQDIYFDAMQASTENLLVIINDILDISKIDAGKLEIENVPTDPHQVVQNVHQLLKFRAIDKGLQFDITIAPEVPKSILCDPARLNQVLVNLVGNAIKFTEDGRVEINVSFIDDWIEFKVIDTGIGISSDKKEVIFQSFKQASNRTNRDFGGTGLGLTISKHLVEMLGGSIGLQSQPGQGSTFWFRLPVVLSEVTSDHSEMATHAAVMDMASKLEGIHVLLVEDNEFNRMIARNDLEHFIPGVDLDIAVNGVEAVEKFTYNQYDVVLMDIQMPEMDGHQASKEIRSLENVAGLPIIAMTASLLKNEIEQCFESGMDDYIPKPYTAMQLIKTIHGAIEKYRNTSNLSTDE